MAAKELLASISRPGGKFHQIRSFTQSAAAAAGVGGRGGGRDTDRMLD